MIPADCRGPSRPAPDIAIYHLSIGRPLSPSVKAARTRNDRHKIGVSRVPQTLIAEIVVGLSELGDLVGLDTRQLEALPRSLSGGQRQRVAIARALAAEPRLVILDESVAALDVSIQAQVLNLLADIRERTGVSYLLISHDLAVVRQITDEAIVMHRGSVVERGPTRRVLDDPQAEYTKMLRASVPMAGWKPVRRSVRPSA